jgi:hypothetical protein
MSRLKVQFRRTRYYAVLAAALAVALSLANDGVAGGHGGGHAPEAAAEEEDIGAEFKTRGIEIGEFHIRAYYPVEAQKSTIRFVLYVAVSSDHFAEAQQLVDTHRHLLRDQAITATRMAPLLVLDEPELENFRRRMFLRFRRALPELAMENVYVSEFQLTVQSL